MHWPLTPTETVEYLGQTLAGPDHKRLTRPGNAFHWPDWNVSHLNARSPRLGGGIGGIGSRDGRGGGGEVTKYLHKDPADFLWCSRWKTRPEKIASKEGIVIIV